MARIAALLIALLVALAGCDSDEDAPDPRPARAAAAERPAGIGRAGLDEHLRALQRIAAANGGNRAAGRPGERASAEYIAARLREAGWRVRVQPVPFPFFRERSSRLSVDGERRARNSDFLVLQYSGTGAVGGRTQEAGSGCSASDFEGLAEGALALVSRGPCPFRVKAENAERAGARALLVTDPGGDPGEGRPTLGGLGVEIPVLLVLGDIRDGAPVRLAVRAEYGRRESSNVIAETLNGEAGRVVMAGAHLDSVPEGPGINDNGSGVAALLELAEALGPRPGGARVRLGFWGAEELGLIGSRRYVASLGAAERRRIAAYLNFDMVGSPNPEPSVYSDGSPGLERVLRRADGRELEEEGTGGASDHASFQRAGIRVSGLYTGSLEEGPGGRPRDPCYHRACDTAKNVDRRVLLRMARSALRAVRSLAGR